MCQNQPVNTNLPIHGKEKFALLQLRNEYLTLGKGNIQLQNITITSVHRHGSECQVSQSSLSQQISRWNIKRRLYSSQQIFSTKHRTKLFQRHVFFPKKSQKILCLTISSRKETSSPPLLEASRRWWTIPSLSAPCRQWPSRWSPHGCHMDHTWCWLCFVTIWGRGWKRE